MRVIGGKLRGKNISFIKNLNTRPLKDSVKENIFNILQHSNLINIDILNSNVLDLYSGVGSFGIEAISRGASKVIFIDKDNAAQRTLKKNLQKLKITTEASVINNEIEREICNIEKKKFSIFFFDPPFKDLNYLKIINSIRKKNLFNKRHIVIIHREKNSNENLNEDLAILVTKVYGRSKIFFANFLT